jgi:hypothetical protein
MMWVVTAAGEPFAARSGGLGKRIIYDHKSGRSPTEPGVRERSKKGGF